ncbi:5068_t:CDS:2 [Scutellospora calospora]|uniref:5068_t:CDS:1 n=1 Tax=Scutellospora calospora TaxID=85575 RepID=A0ACA9JVC4_9GLOM|nr:5068_t:CDS:2 [Scutellospora calospora]
MALNKSLKTGHLYSGSDDDNSINDNMDIDEIPSSKTTIKESKIKFKAISQALRKVVDNDVKQAEKSFKALCDVMPPQLRLIMNGSSIKEVFGNVNMEFQLTKDHKEQMMMNESYTFVSPPSTITNKDINYTRESDVLLQNNVNQLNHLDNNNQVHIDDVIIDDQVLASHLNERTQSEQDKTIELTNNENSSTTTISSSKRKSTQPRKFIIEHHETESRIIRNRARPYTKKRKDVVSSDESDNMQAEAFIYSVDNRNQTNHHNTDESSDDDSITSCKPIKLAVPSSIPENQDSRKQKVRSSTRKIAKPIVQKGKNSIDPSINSDKTNTSQGSLNKTTMKAARKFAAPVPKPIPEKPQRPLGSFGYFRKEMFDNRDSLLVGLPWRECIKIVAQRWNSLSEEDKQPYCELQRIASKKFKVENRVYLDYLKEHGLAEDKKSKEPEKITRKPTYESRKKNTIGGSEERKPRKVKTNSLKKPSTVSESKTSVNKKINTIRAGATRKAGVTKIFIPFVHKD